MMHVLACLLLTTSALGAPAQVLEVGPSRAAMQRRSARTPDVVCGTALAALVRQSVSAALPLGQRLRGVHVGSLCVPQRHGPLRAEVSLPEQLVRGRNPVTAYFASGKQGTDGLLVHVDLEPTVAAQATRVMVRGTEINVVVRSSHVMVQAKAVAQESAGLGEPVRVLPMGGQRVVQGRVLDAQTVEVTL
jgi:hypothetical protein